MKVTDGALLPFSYDILTTMFQYGNRAFTKYPADIQDYFKQTFPEGYYWERSMTYEDRGICTATSDIRLGRIKTDASCRENEALGSSSEKKKIVEFQSHCWFKPSFSVLIIVLFPCLPKGFSLCIMSWRTKWKKVVFNYVLPLVVGLLNRNVHQSFHEILILTLPFDICLIALSTFLRHFFFNGMDGDCFVYDIRFHGVNRWVQLCRRRLWNGSHPLRKCTYVMGCWWVMLTWLCCLKEVAITDVISKVLTSRFCRFVDEISLWLGIRDKRGNSINSQVNLIDRCLSGISDLSSDCLMMDCAPLILGNGVVHGSKTIWIF